MTTIQLRKVMLSIQKLEKDIETLEDVQIKLASEEFASATLSTGSGSRTYTRADVGNVNQVLSILRKRLRAYRLLLQGKSDIAPSSIYTIYEG